MHKELSVTPLHAKIPLLTMKCRIVGVWGIFLGLWLSASFSPETLYWCNMCIDLVGFTSEIFRGAAFQSLDGISISANCKLRKILTLESKPQETAEKDDSSINRRQHNIRTGETQDVSHTAFGSKILGPPPSSNRGVNTRVSGEEHDWKNYQSNRLSSSELQMLASIKRQQSEESGDTGISRELSASQMNNCNVSLSTSSDDTAASNSCFPPPTSLEHRYQKEMSPLSHSNPWDWMDVFSPPIIPRSQQLEKHTKSSTNQSTPGDFNDLSAEED